MGDGVAIAYYDEQCEEIYCSVDCWESDGCNWDYRVKLRDKEDLESYGFTVESRCTRCNNFIDQHPANREEG